MYFGDTYKVCAQSAVLLTGSHSLAGQCCVPSAEGRKETASDDLNFLYILNILSVLATWQYLQVRERSYFSCS